MLRSLDCPFCKSTRFKNNKLADLPAEDTILFENENIYVQVDISPLCLGHILIITNDHYLNFFETSNEIKKDVIKIKDKIKEIYKQVYNADVLFFEHGSAQSGYAGASINHAHLHCIPYKFDISDSLYNLLGEPIECDILSSYDFNNEFSYIYLESEQNGNLIYKVNKLPSQFLRRLLSVNYGNNEYLWQEKCRTEDNKKNLNQTISDLKNKLFF